MPDLTRRAALAAAFPALPVFILPQAAAARPDPLACPFLRAARAALAAFHAAAADGPRDLAADPSAALGQLETLARALLLMPPGTAPEAARLIARARFAHPRVPGAFACPMSAEALALHLKGD